MRRKGRQRIEPVHHALTFLQHLFSSCIREEERKDFLVHGVTKVKKNTPVAVVESASPPPTPSFHHISPPFALSVSFLCVAGIGFAYNYLAGGDGIV
jgi:hypothetical protein